jgi:hypothetical protein
VEVISNASFRLLILALSFNLLHRNMVLLAK